MSPSSDDDDRHPTRVTVLGSGDPFVKHSQASASLLIDRD